MTQAIDIITGALRKITSYQPGETISSQDQADALVTLNELLDSWSTDQQYVFGTNENILQWIAGQSQYTVGNPMSDELGLPPFIGTVTHNSNIITGITNIPTGLVQGALLTDLANVVPRGTTVTAIGASTVTMSAVASATPSNNPDTLTYSIPGDFGIERPLRITGGYTRINQLDFTLDVYASQDEYNSILFKQQRGPWPTVAWYNNQFPYGILNVYMTPSQSAELHLFSDGILSNLTLNQTIIMPQGYARALKWLLARELAPEYGYVFTFEQKKIANEAMMMIKALNAEPAPRATYDRELIRGDRADGGWITHGGYR